MAAFLKFQPYKKHLIVHIVMLSIMTSMFRFLCLLLFVSAVFLNFCSVT